MLEAMIIYSLSISPPNGYTEIKSAICKQAYNINLDGYILKPNGERIVIRGKCYKKDISNG